MSEYNTWLEEVKVALRSINMPMEEWQKAWRFDFESEYHAGLDAGKAAEKANRYWWREQNKVINQNCSKDPECWLPRDHEGKCQPVEEKQ